MSPTKFPTNLNKDFFQLFFQISRKSKLDTVYDTTATLEALEICKAGIETNLFIKTILNVMRTAQYGLFEACSRAGEVRSYNISYMNSTLITMWPGGDYRAILRLFDSLDDNIFNATYDSSVFH